jgi:hypothetical protein
MADWSVAVQAFKVELRTAGVAQVRRIGMSGWPWARTAGASSGWSSPARSGRSQSD